jgi:hypothetical protein
MTAEELGLVELSVPDLADVAGTVAGDPAGGTTDGAVDSSLPESVKVLARELWRDEVKRRAVLQMLGALAAGAALDGAPLQRPPDVPVAHASEVADHLARAQGRPLAVVVGSMLELGPDSDKLHATLAAEIVARNPALVGAVGEFLRAFDAHRSVLGHRLVTADDADALGPKVRAGLSGNEVILVKASRGVALERVLRHLV